MLFSKWHVGQLSPNVSYSTYKTQYLDKYISLQKNSKCSILSQFLNPLDWLCPHETDAIVQKNNNKSVIISVQVTMPVKILSSQLTRCEVIWNSQWAHFEDIYLAHTVHCELVASFPWVCILTLWACCELFVRSSQWAHHAVVAVSSLRRNPVKYNKLDLQQIVP